MWCDRDNRVLAYYSLAAHEVLRENAPGKVSRGSPERIPALLLGRLALDESLHGKGLGGQLLADALARALAAADSAGARLVVVDAIDEAAATFYERYGFTRVPGGARLSQKVSSIDKAIRPSLFGTL